VLIFHRERHRSLRGRELLFLATVTLSFLWTSPLVAISSFSLLVSVYCVCVCFALGRRNQLLSPQSFFFTPVFRFVSIGDEPLNSSDKAASILHLTIPPQVHLGTRPKTGPAFSLQGCSTPTPSSPYPLSTSNCFAYRCGKFLPVRLSNFFPRTVPPYCMLFPPSWPLVRSLRSLPPAPSLAGPFEVWRLFNSDYLSPIAPTTETTYSVEAVFSVPNGSETPPHISSPLHTVFFFQRPHWSDFMLPNDIESVLSPPSFISFPHFPEFSSTLLPENVPTEIEAFFPDTDSSVFPPSA